uniref:Uncharacterized protein n=1 Tax=Romanomermis culicivorax TaxID=13658 RepID=A0A915HYP5_ROMCU
MIDAARLQHNRNYGRLVDQIIEIDLIIPDKTAFVETPSAASIISKRSVGQGRSGRQKRLGSVALVFVALIVIETHAFIANTFQAVYVFATVGALTDNERWKVKPSAFILKIKALHFQSKIMYSSFSNETISVHKEFTFIEFVLSSMFIVFDVRPIRSILGITIDRHHRRIVETITAIRIKRFNAIVAT